MSTITTLAEAQITPTASVIIELIESDETVPVIIITWPGKPTGLHPSRFGNSASTIASTFAAATVRLAAIRRETGRL